MSSDLETIGLDAVDAFITTFNTRNASDWADTLQFPHVRPSPIGPILSIPNKEAYVEGFDYNKIIETGWDHSEWDYKRFLHKSPRKLHVAGQWSRYDADGNKIKPDDAVDAIGLAVAYLRQDFILLARN